MSNRISSIFIGACALASTVGLVGHFAVSPPPTSFTSQAILEAAAAHHTAMLTAAWLDGMGSVLLIVTFVAIAEAAGRLGTLAGRILLVAGAGVVAQSLLTDTLLIAAAQIDAAGNPATAAAILQMAHAADYAFPIINAFWAPALGLIVLRSRLLPAAFGWVALIFGAVELVGGLVSLYSDQVNAVVNPLFMVMLAWNLAAAAVLLVRALRKAPPVRESHQAQTA